MTPREAADAAAAAVGGAVPQQPTIEVRFGVFTGARTSPSGLVPITDVPAWLVAFHGLGSQGTGSVGLGEVTSFVVVRDADGMLANGALMTESGTEHLP